MSAYPDQPSPEQGGPAPLSVLASEPINATTMGLAFMNGNGRRALSGHAQQVLEDLDMRNATHRQLARALGLLCCEIRQLPTFLTFRGEMEEEDREVPTAGGRFSVVRKGTHNGKVVVSKQFLIPSLRDENTVAQARDILWRDIFLWKKLSHENVIPFYGVHTVRGSGLTFVYPWAENRDIKYYLEANPGASRSDLLYQVIKGLQYLHIVDIVHGTLKASNVLINGSGGVWLTDYGLYPFRKYRNPGGCTTPWDAPEVLISDLVLKPADIFSFAMLVVEVFTGEKPFGGSKSDTLVSLWITQGKRPQRPMDDQGVGFSDGVWDIVQRCWTQNPGERPIIDDVVKAWG